MADFLQLSTSADTWWRLPRAGLSVRDDGTIQYPLLERKEYSLESILKRPNKSPHVEFRNLRYGRPTDSVKFLTRFGPLTYDEADVVEDEMRNVGTLNLKAFWARWRRFIAVVQLWEAHPKSPNSKGPSVTSIKAAFDYAIAHRREVDSIPGPPLFDEQDWKGWWLALSDRPEERGEITTTSAPWPGAVSNAVKSVAHEMRLRYSDDDSGARYYEWTPSPTAPADHHDAPVLVRNVHNQYFDKSGRLIPKPKDFGEIPNPEKGIPQLNDSKRNELALLIVERELNRHAEPKSTWVKVQPHGLVESVSFRLHLSRQSLWQLIWTWFAQETCAPHPWRICPHCNRAFYPSRRDRFFCTPRLQQLYSKRRWAQSQKNAPRRRS